MGYLYYTYKWTNVKLLTCHMTQIGHCNTEHLCTFWFSLLMSMILLLLAVFLFLIHLVWKLHLAPAPDPVSPVSSSRNPLTSENFSLAISWSLEKGFQTGYKKWNIRTKKIFPNFQLYRNNEIFQLRKLIICHHFKYLLNLKPFSNS